MHPVLAARARFAVYLIAWIPLLALVAFVSRAPGSAWHQNVVTVFPAILLFAFTCLSPWYICRVQPLQVSEVARLTVTWTSAAITAGALLAGGAYLGARVFGNALPDLGLVVGLGAILYILSAGLHYTAIAAQSSRAAEQRAAEARTLARDAELQALRMQINPHFLFNSLHSIAALATQDGGRAREMCIHLSDFLRSSLGVSGRESIPLAEELALARSYLVVEQIRFGSRLKFTEQIDPACEACAIPALLLQPLIENAVKHGIAGLVEGGEIVLAVYRREGEVAVAVENAFDPETPAQGRLGVGLAHIRRRLALRYGTAARLEAAPRAPGIFRAELRFPCDAGPQI